MILFGTFLIIFGLIIIYFPQFIAYLIAGFFILIGINIILANLIFFKRSKKEENYIKFGKYKIFR